MNLSSSSGRTSSLVFGAGTIQWSWALSTFHDHDETTHIDRNLQHATLNIFAEMHVLPGLLQYDPLVVPDLVLPSLPNDYDPPISTILTPKHQEIIRFSHAVGEESFCISVRGIARDVSVDGLGRVGAVEISFDEGVTWYVTQGREHWSFRYPLSSSSSRSCSYDNFLLKWDKLRHQQPRTSNSKKRNEINPKTTGYSLSIWTRAVDDSGWMEEVHNKSRTQPSNKITVTIEVY